jgi:hypothetical integral membrane protein (TIGR02206 family)
LAGEVLGQKLTIPDAVRPERRPRGKPFMTTFRPFSVTHALVVLAFVTMTAVLVIRRRGLRGTPDAAERFDRRLGVAAVIVWIVTTLVQFLPRYYDRTSSLPLHVCDFTIIAVPLALLTNWRPARALTYFWGIGLSTQGFITPDLRFGPATVLFWVFWSTHFLIVGGALYEVLARGSCPSWKDAALACVAGIVYVALVLPFDIVTGLNYGYVGRSAPGQPSLVDALGPWPGRVGVMMGLGAVVMAVLVAPWEIVRRARRIPPAAATA